MICKEEIDLAHFVLVFPSSCVYARSSFDPFVLIDSEPQSIKQRLCSRLKREAEVVSWGVRDTSKYFLHRAHPRGTTQYLGNSRRLKVYAEERNRKQENENEKRKEGKGGKTEMDVAGGQTHALTMIAVFPRCCL